MSAAYEIPRLARALRDFSGKGWRRDPQPDRQNIAGIERDL
ncbi:hypothetical protein [Lysobacter sp. Root690]|nr:hypothetical protein [Lysobacter sp. Root690]